MTARSYSPLTAMFTLLSLAALCAVVTASSGRCVPGTFTGILESFEMFEKLSIPLITYYAPTRYNIVGVSNSVPFCAVNAKAAYGVNSSITFTLWLPDEYSGRFVAVGNGGLAGTIDYSNMLEQLNAGLGFAVAGSDGGHSAMDNNGGVGAPGVYYPFLHSPEEVETWIHDSISLFTPVAKAMTDAFYGEKAKATRHTYFNGCSTGGAQGIALAQYHPELFDGIVAGSPGNWYSHLALSFLWNARHTSKPDSRLSQDLLDEINNAVVEACDELDGLKDGVIDNPLKCHWDIRSLNLTDEQHAAADAIYAGPTEGCKGKQIYPGFSFGSESGWFLQEGNLANLFTAPILQNLVYQDLAYNLSSFDFSSDVGDVDERAGQYIDANSTDLSAFRSRRGKLVLTQGWADPLNAAVWPIQYREQLETVYGNSIEQFVKLFMIPGGGHCGAAGHYSGVPARYHTMEQLVKWVERHRRPEYVLSSDPPDGSSGTRKLCPWPKQPHFVSGDYNDARRYICIR